MINIIKMDLYKMVKSKSFYVLNLTLLVIILFIGIFMAATLNMDYETARDANVSFSLEDDSMVANDPELTEEEYYGIMEEMEKNLDAKEFMVMAYPIGIPTILLAIFIATFVCSELDSGFIKNIIPLKASRYSLIAGKNIVALFFIVIQTLLALSASILATVIISGSPNIIDIKELLIYAGIQGLLHMAFSSLIILVSYIFKSKAVSISAGILLAVNIHRMFLSFIDDLLNISIFKLADLSIIGSMKKHDFDIEIYKRIIILSIGYFLLYNVASLIRTRKMEVN